MSAAAAMRTIAKIAAVVAAGTAIAGMVSLAAMAWLAPAHFLRG